MFKFLKINSFQIDFKLIISNFKLRRESGFTLIEIIVVLAIIAMLSGLAMTNLTSVIQRSRDSQRKADLRQIQSALELYRADQGSYPTAVKNCPNGSPVSLGNVTCDKIYLNSVPQDPSGGNYAYNKNVSGGYSLIACLEKDNDPDIDIVSGAKANCASPNDAKWQYTLKNP